MLSNKRATNLNVEAFRKYLTNANHPELDIKFIEDGFPMYLDPKKGPPVNLSQEEFHIVDSWEHVFKILDTIIDELARGCLIPVETKPDYLIVLFCAPKKPKAHQTHAWRVVRHCSFARFLYTSINEWIDPDKCRMHDLLHPIPNLKSYCKVFYKKSRFSGRDLKDAFRQILMTLEDAQKLGYTVFGKYFREDRQPYGLRSAAQNCQHFVSMIIWIFETYKLRPDQKGRTLVHIDDFAFCGFSQEEVDEMSRLFDELMEELGIQVSHNKSFTSVSREIQYGFDWDLHDQTVGIPQLKLERLTIGISMAIEHRIITIRALHAISGQIMHWSQLHHASKSLCRNIIDTIHKWSDITTLPNTQWVFLPLSVIDDFRFWLKHIQVIKRVRIESILALTRCTRFAATDASGRAGGVVCGSRWFAYEFQGKHREWNINQKEAHAIIMLIHNMRHQLTGRKIQIDVDNMAVFHGIRRKWSPTRSLMVFIYEICLLMIEYHIDIWISWVRTNSNVMADALSRNRMDIFYWTFAAVNATPDTQSTHYEYYDKFRMPTNGPWPKSDKHEYQRLLEWHKKDMKDRRAAWWLTKNERKHLKKITAENSRENVFKKRQAAATKAALNRND